MNDNDILTCMDIQVDKRKNEIRNTRDGLFIRGNTYYISNQGNDENDGRSPNTPWKSLKKVSEHRFSPGDGVLFCRGDIFRGNVRTQSDVSYGAYGTGAKPRFYGWDKNLADPHLWTEIDPDRHIWKYGEKILDVGTLVFGRDELCSRKLIPSYIDGKFVCRDDEHHEFDMREEMTENLDLYWHFDEKLTISPSRGLCFPVPAVEEDSFGELFLRSDEGNPALVYGSIEALTKRPAFRVGSDRNVVIDNLCIKYVGHHAISAGGHVVGLHVTNCEIGWIGGTIQHYLGTDPNFPEGGRGSVTRFGNAIEIYGGCEDYLVQNCYIYQVYDAGITHQITTNGKKHMLSEIRYLDNLIEDCVYAIEYFLDMTEGDTESLMSDVVMQGNILRRSGYGWGQQRHNVNTPALIKGWSYINKAKDFHIKNNVFDRSAYRMIHLVAYDEDSCPEMSDNTYIQNDGGMLGQYGANRNSEPPLLMFDKNIENTVKDLLGDKGAKIYTVN